MAGTHGPPPRPPSHRHRHPLSRCAAANCPHTLVVHGWRGSSGPRGFASAGPGAASGCGWRTSTHRHPPLLQRQRQRPDGRGRLKAQGTQPAFCGSVPGAASATIDGFDVHVLGAAGVAGGRGGGGGVAAFLGNLAVCRCSPSPKGGGGGGLSFCARAGSNVMCLGLFPLIACTCSGTTRVFAKPGCAPKTPPPRSFPSVLPVVFSSHGLLVFSVMC